MGIDVSVMLVVGYAFDRDTEEDISELEEDYESDRTFSVLRSSDGTGVAGVIMANVDAKHMIGDPVQFLDPDEMSEAAAKSRDEFGDRFGGDPRIIFFMWIN